MILGTCWLFYIKAKSGISALDIFAINLHFFWNGKGTTAGRSAGGSSGRSSGGSSGYFCRLLLLAGGAGGDGFIALPALPTTHGCSCSHSRWSGVVINWLDCNFFDTHLYPSWEGRGSGGCQGAQAWDFLSYEGPGWIKEFSTAHSQAVPLEDRPWNDGKVILDNCSIVVTLEHSCGSEFAKICITYQDPDPQRSWFCVRMQL